MDDKMRNLPCRLIQVDEVWGYVGMKKGPRYAIAESTESVMCGRGLRWIRKRNSFRLSQWATVLDIWRRFIEDLASRLSQPRSTFQ